MIATYYSNSYEFLRKLLGELIAGRRREGAHGPFSRDHILVPSAAVADDLNMHLARTLGVSTGLWLDYVGRWLSRFTNRAGSAQGTFLDDLDWMILALVHDAEFLSRPECARLRHFVEGQTPAALCAFSQRLARLFTTYTSYRLDWVIEWMGNDPAAFHIKDNERRRTEARVLEAHPDYRWQRAMWREFKERVWGLEKAPWPGCEYLEGVSEKWRELLKRRIAPESRPQMHVFLPSGLPPLALPFLQALSKSQDIFIYCLNPSSAYWFEALPPTAFENWPQSSESSTLAYLHRNAASTRAQIERLWNFSLDPETGAEEFYEDDCTEVPEPGRPGLLREADPSLDVSRLLELRASDATGQSQTMVYVRPGRRTVLGALQEAILEDDLGRLAGRREADDHSITIVKAPSAAREVEGLADWIQSLIARTAQEGSPIAAEDILVVTPDINAMAPVINAVLENRTGRQALAYSIVGQSAGEVNSAAQAILAAGRFLAGRADRESLEALLQYPITTAGRGAHGLDLQTAGVWLAAAGYRFGINEAHVRDLLEEGLARPEGGPGAAFDGTLERALERLNLGAFMRGDVRVSLAGAYASRGTELGGFSRVDGSENAALLSFLLGLWESLSAMIPGRGRRSPADWKAWTHTLIHTLFPCAEASDEVYEFRGVVDRMVEVMQRVQGETPVDFQSFWTMLSLKVRDEKTPVRSTGRIVFAPIDALRWLPRRAIAVLGLNEGPNFPGVNRSEEFDLMQAELVDERGRRLSTRRRGDRDSRANNRNVFFDLIVSAREYFYCSYTAGTGPVEKNPSVVLSDLKQTLALGLGDMTAVDRELTVRLAPQAAAPESFDAALGMLQSHDETAARAVNAALAVNYLDEADVFLNEGVVQGLDENEGARAGLREIIECFTGPDEWLVRAAGLDAGRLEDAPAPRLEAAFKSSLVNSGFIRRTLAELRAGRTGEELITALEDDPSMGLGVLRGHVVREKVSALEMGVSEIEALLEGTISRRMPSQTVEFAHGRYRRLALPAATVYEKSDGSRFTVFDSTSKADRRRALLKFLALGCVHDDVSAWAADFTQAPKVDDSGEPVLEGFLSCWRSPRDAGQSKTPRRVMELLLQIFERQALDSPALAQPERNGRGDDSPKGPDDGGIPLWLGRGNRDELRERTQRLFESIDALAGLFEAPAPADGAKDAKKGRSGARGAPDPQSVLGAFEQAASDILEALGEAQC